MQTSWGSKNCTKQKAFCICIPPSPFCLILREAASVHNRKEGRHFQGLTNTSAICLPFYYYIIACKIIGPWPMPVYRFFRYHFPSYSPDESSVAALSNILLPFLYLLSILFQHVNLTIYSHKQLQLGPSRCCRGNFISSGYHRYRFKLTDTYYPL